MSEYRKYRVAIIGCGALGAEIANLIVRSKVSFLRLIDRDFLEQDDAKTHFLFKRHIFKEGLPKAVALHEFLGKENSTVTIESIVDDVNRTNVLRFIHDVDLVIDAVNNSFTHLLINEASVKLRTSLLVSWLDGSRGAAMAVIPGKSSCLNCIIDSKTGMSDVPLDKREDSPPDTITAIAKLQTARAREILDNPQSKPDQRLYLISADESIFKTIDITKSKIQPNCSVCNNRQFSRLDGKIGSTYIHPIKVNTLQVIPFQPQKIDLPTLAFNLADKGDVLVNDFLLIFRKAPYELVIFPDGRAFVQGTTDSGIALDLVKKYLRGNG